MSASSSRSGASCRGVRERRLARRLVDAGDEGPPPFHRCGSGKKVAGLSRSTAPVATQPAGSSSPASPAEGFGVRAIPIGLPNPPPVLDRRSSWSGNMVCRPGFGTQPRRSVPHRDTGLVGTVGIAFENNIHAPAGGRHAVGGVMETDGSSTFVEAPEQHVTRHLLLAGRQGRDILSTETEPRPSTSAMVAGDHGRYKDVN